MISNALEHPLENCRKLGLVGPLGVGKDYIATKLGAKIIGFADPIYALASLLYPGVNGADKTAPGVRKLLQQLGQYGRGTVDDSYPLTAERAHFCQWLRHDPVAEKCRVTLAGFEVVAENFGQDVDLWANALLRRANRLATLHPEQLVAVTNVRFENEVSVLRQAGFKIACVVCGFETLDTRQAGRSRPEDRANISERFGREEFGKFHYNLPDGIVDFYITNDTTLSACNHEHKPTLHL